MEKSEFIHKVEFYDVATLMLLAALVWGEARGEPWAGKLAVAWVVKNRVDAQKKYYGKDFVDVMLKRNQFSCFNHGVSIERLRKDVMSDMKTWKDCVDAASYVLKGTVLDNTYGATYYVNKRLKGKLAWMKNLVHTVDIGNHSFYKEKEEK